MKKFLDDSVITCDEIMGTPDTVSIDSINKETSIKTNIHITILKFKMIGND